MIASLLHVSVLLFLLVLIFVHTSSQTLSHVARRCVHQRLVPHSASQVTTSPITPAEITPETTFTSSRHSNYLPFISSHPVGSDPDPETLSDLITTTPSTPSDSESDSERSQHYTTPSTSPLHSAGYLVGVDPDLNAKSPRQPDLLDRIIDGMRRAKTQAALERRERRERERCTDNGVDSGGEYNEGEGEDGDEENIKEEDVVTEAMLLL